MANIAVQLTIGDYDDWRPVFNKHKKMREEKAGIKSEQVYCDAENPTEVLLWFETTDAAKTREVIQSEEVKGHWASKDSRRYIALPAAGIRHGPCYSFRMTTLSMGYLLQNASPASMMRGRSSVDKVPPAALPQRHQSSL